MRILFEYGCPSCLPDTLWRSRRAADTMMSPTRPGQERFSELAVDEGVADQDQCDDAHEEIGPRRQDLCRALVRFGEV
jgi:hypothetical protein